MGRIFSPASTSTLIEIRSSEPSSLVERRVVSSIIATEVAPFGTGAPVAILENHDSEINCKEKGAQVVKPGSFPL
jgi:hypothetical protein